MKSPKEWELPAHASPAKKRKHREQMIAWLHYKLDNEHDAMARRANSEENYEKHAAWMSGDGYALYAAQHGNIEPLRQRYPQFRDFLHLPRHKGRRPKPRTSITLARFAAEDVQRVRRFWQEQYNKFRRKVGDQLAAENVVAMYYKNIGYPEVTIATIKAAMKPSGKHKTPRRKIRDK
jgi:hypothetical protein